MNKRKLPRRGQVAVMCHSVCHRVARRTFALIYFQALSSTAHGGTLAPAQLAAVPSKLLTLFEKFLAGEPGLEPRSTESESAVLPLNYSPAEPYSSAVRSEAGLRGGAGSL